MGVAPIDKQQQHATAVSLAKEEYKHGNASVGIVQKSTRKTIIATLLWLFCTYKASLFISFLRKVPQTSPQNIHSESQVTALLLALLFCGLTTQCVR